MNTRYHVNSYLINHTGGIRTYHLGWAAGLQSKPRHLNRAYNRTLPSLCSCSSLSLSIPELSPSWFTAKISHALDRPMSKCQISTRFMPYCVGESIYLALSNLSSLCSLDLEHRLRPKMLLKMQYNSYLSKIKQRAIFMIKILLFKNLIGINGFDSTRDDERTPCADQGRSAGLLPHLIH